MLKDILQLAVRTTTPATALTGSIMISGSAGTIGMYVYTGEAVGGWARVSLT